MPDNEPTPTPNPEPGPRPRGYFNQSQLEDIATGESVLSAAQSHAAALADKDIDAAYLTGFAAALQQARDKATETGQSGDASEAETMGAAAAERALITALQGIQSAAKQKHRMLAEDGDPATNFSTNGYLIGERLNPNHTGLVQNANALIAKARADSLPGYRTPEAIAAVEAALTLYKNEDSAQATAEEERAKDRIARDALITRINSRRLAIQHAADGIWPYTNPDNRPVRRTFQLPLSRPLNG